MSFSRWTCPGRQRSRCSSWTVCLGSLSVTVSDRPCVCLCVFLALIRASCNFFRQGLTAPSKSGLRWLRQRFRWRNRVVRKIAICRCRTIKALELINQGVTDGVLQIRWWYAADPRPEGIPGGMAAGRVARDAQFLETAEHQRVLHVSTLSLGTLISLCVYLRLPAHCRSFSFSLRGKPWVVLFYPGCARTAAEVDAIVARAVYSGLRIARDPVVRLSRFSLGAGSCGADADAVFQHAAKQFLGAEELLQRSTDTYEWESEAGWNYAPSKWVGITLFIRVTQCADVDLLNCRFKVAGGYLHALGGRVVSSLFMDRLLTVLTSPA